MSTQKPVPKTKDELISMLKEQLQKVEDQINEMQSTLQGQRQKRKQLTSELQEKEKKVQEMIQNQAQTLGDKVNQGLYNTLQTANKIRAEAQAQVRKIIQDNSLLNEKITHKDNKVNEERKAIDLNFKKLSVLQQKKIDAQRKQSNLINKKEDIKKNNDMMKKQFERIQKEQQQLRNHLQNAKKLRLYLNKHLQGITKTSNNNHLPQNVNPKRANLQQPSDSFWNT